MNSIPCELCKFLGKTTAEYLRHVKDKHAEHTTASKNNDKTKSKENVKKSSSKPKHSAVEIPCDICQFKSTSAEDFINHIETQHQHKPSGNSGYACDKCDYKCTTEEQFKKHLEMAHKLNVGGWRTPQNKQYLV